jgi:hypothetical protein
MLPEMKQLEIGTSSFTCLQLSSSPFMMVRSGAGGMAEEEEHLFCPSHDSRAAAA